MQERYPTEASNSSEKGGNETQGGWQPKTKRPEENVSKRDAPTRALLHVQAKRTFVQGLHKKDEKG